MATKLIIIYNKQTNQGHVGSFRRIYLQPPRCTFEVLEKRMECKAYNIRTS